MNGEREREYACVRVVFAGDGVVVDVGIVSFVCFGCCFCLCG